jgi:hypothetical protein
MVGGGGMVVCRDLWRKDENLLIRAIVLLQFFLFVNDRIQLLIIIVGNECVDH